MNHEYEVVISKKIYIEARSKDEARKTALWEFYDRIDKDENFDMDYVKVKQVR